MPIDPSKALGTEIQGEDMQWDADRVILYHLGVGAGTPPTDPNELSYTYEKGLKVLPSFAVIVGSRASLRLANVPGMEFNPALLLHGEHDLELNGTIPTAAKAINTVRIKDIFDKGKAALVKLEVESRDENGQLLFVNRPSIFLRGEGGFGGESGPPAGNLPPDREPDTVLETPIMPQQALLYRLSGDKNPLHADPEFAKMGGFDQPILHGLCTFGMVCKALVDAELGGDVSRVARYQVRFAGVVFPGETLVTRVWREDDRLVLQTDVKERGTPALTNAAMTLRN